MFLSIILKYSCFCARFKEDPYERLTFRTFEYEGVTYVRRQPKMKAAAEEASAFIPFTMDLCFCDNVADFFVGSFPCLLFAGSTKKCAKSWKSVSFFIKKSWKSVYFCVEIVGKSVYLQP